MTGPTPTRAAASPPATTSPQPDDHAQRRAASAKRQLHALLRPPGRAFPRCLTRRTPRPEIDLARARAQHRALVDTLQSLDVLTHVLDPLDAQPDSVFVEDTALLTGTRAICLPFAVDQRRGEETPIAAALEAYMPVEYLPAELAVDGGDCMLTERDLFVGVSSRSSRTAIEALAARVPERRLRTVELRPELLHLKCAATYLGEDRILLSPQLVDPSAFAGYERIEVAPGEEDAANGLVLDGRVLLPPGHPRTRARLEAAGLEVVPVDLSEFAKGDGSVTCLSLVWHTPLVARG